MADNQLADYIKQLLAAGQQPDQIKIALKADGWAEQDIAAAFAASDASLAAAGGTAPAPSASPAQNQLPRSPSALSIKKLLMGGGALVILIIAVVAIALVPRGGTSTTEDNSTQEATASATPSTGEEPTSPIPAEPRECGEDVNCLINASLTCSPADATITTSINLLTVQVTTKQNFEIIGKEEDACVFYLQTLQQNVRYIQSYKQELFERGLNAREISSQERAANEEAQIVVGKDGICRFPIKSDLTALLEQTKSGTLITDQLNGTFCQGSLFETIVISPTPTPYSEKTVLDCFGNTDPQCTLSFLEEFSQNLENCSIHKGTTPIGWEPILGIFRSYEITGLQNNTCSVNFEILDSGSLPPELLNKTMTCNYNESERTIETVASGKNCSGTLYEAFMKFLEENYPSPTPQ